MDKINIFVLAAGRGERLRPITDHIPKPLIPVLGQPAIEHILHAVSDLCLNKIGINLHYKKKAIEDWLGQCAWKDRIRIFREDTLLGTGGALKNAESFLREGTFLVHNSDILSDINLKQLLEYHFASGNFVTLAIHNYPKFNSLVIDEKGRLTGLGRGQTGDDIQRWAFTGVAVYEPGFLEFLPEGASGVVDAWLKASSAGYTIGTFGVSGEGPGACAFWRDIGTPASYASAVFRALRNDGEVIYTHSSLRDCDDVNLQGHVVIEKNCQIKKGVSLRNALVLPGSSVGGGDEVKLQNGEDRLFFNNCIIGPDFRIDLNEPEILDYAEDKQLIGTGGSDRRYYRVRQGNSLTVLMQCRKDDPEFDRQLEYTRFFLRQGIPVPSLIQVNADKMQALVEDAGDISLYSYLKCPRIKSDREELYQKVLDVLIQLHTRATEHVSECPLLQERIFDYEHFRWETDYFIERFVKGIRNIVVSEEDVLKDELHSIAVMADASPKRIIHRDFQSQNIMIMSGQELRLIDYQGARLGPPAYDVVSLLWDPYYRLEDDMRNRLLDYYIDGVKRPEAQGRSHVPAPGLIDGTGFRESLLPCRLQRHMQALGAYGFLSRVKGKKYFLKFVPEGLRLLKDDISEVREAYPALYGLITRL